MRQRWFAIAPLTVTIAVAAVAHEGHDHKIMGTVAATGEDRLEVKTVKDGKTEVVTLNDQTKILRDRTPVRADSIIIGERVVVTAVTRKDKAGKESLVAKEIRLGRASAPGAQA